MRRAASVAAGEVYQVVVGASVGWGVAEGFGAVVGFVLGFPVGFAVGVVVRFAVVEGDALGAGSGVAVPAGCRGAGEADGWAVGRRVPVPGGGGIRGPGGVAVVGCVEGAAGSGTAERSGASGTADRAGG
ncbi:hypothetical protein AB8850_33675, partial [Streptomyces griseorubens]